jgi:hypothetical protein
VEVENIGDSLIAKGRKRRLPWSHTMRHIAPSTDRVEGASHITTMKLHVLVILIVLLTGVFYLLTIREGHNWGDDFAMYIHHAKNIVEGVDYKETGYIKNPNLRFSPSTFPPVFPTLLAPVYYWWGLNLTAMKVEVILIFLLSLYVIFLAFRHDLPPPYLVTLVAALGLNPWFWQFKENVLSDIPFLLFCYLSLFLIHRTYHMDRAVKSRTLNVLLITLSIYLAYGTRSIGLVLIPCLIASHLITYKRPSAFTIKALILAAALIIIHNVAWRNESDYGVRLQLISLGHAWRNGVELIEMLSAFWVNSYSAALRIVLFATLSCLAIIGYLGKVKEKITCFEIFPVLYLAPFLFLPLMLDTRYLIPIVPLYLFYAFFGIHVISRSLKVKRKVENLVFACVVAAIFASYCAWYTRLDHGPIIEGVAKNESRQLFDYVKNEKSEGSLFLFHKASALSLYAGKRTMFWHWEPDDRKLWSFFRQIKATHLIVGPKSFETYHNQALIIQFVNRNPDKLQETYSNPDFRVYQIKDAP